MLKLFYFVIIGSSISLSFASNINCRRFSGNLKICPPSLDWVAIDGNKSNSETGRVWFHKKRKDSNINTMLVTQDKSNNFSLWSNYISYAKELFTKRNFKIVAENTVNKNLTILKLATPDMKLQFFQGYQKVGNNTWTMSCMGPHQKIILNDCPTFMKNLQTISE
ncbi:MAG: hypothetical protein HOJ35_12960 [Bdellovibrionales bacterium]|nr:hypothetical protein [Bdellovibrionales bacterium]